MSEVFRRHHHRRWSGRLCLRPARRAVGAEGRPASRSARPLVAPCLNIGCIPSKALLQSSENFEEASHSFKDHGVIVESVKLDLARMQARKGEVVTANVKGVEFLFKKNKVTWLKGEGRIAGPGKRQPWTARNTKPSPS